MKDAQLLPVNVLGLPFHPVTLVEAAEVVEAAIQQQQRCFISTPNLNFTVMAQQEPDFYASVLASDLVVADGMPLIWMARFLGLPIKERVAGSDLFDYLSQQARDTKTKVFFFGGEPGIAEQACAKLNATSPGFTGCGFYDPGFVSITQMSQPEIIQHINDCKPDFIVVALGAKKGQQWIMQNRAKLSAPVISHLGAVVNFVAGHVKRAPERWQRVGLEWLWRIKQEPKLYKRYLFDGLSFLRMLFMQVLPLRLLKSQSNAEDTYKTVVLTQQDDNCLIHLSGTYTKSDLNDFEVNLQQLLASDGDVILIDDGVHYLDEVIIARLCQFQAQLQQQERTLYLQAVSGRLKRLLKFSSVLIHFKLI